MDTLETCEECDGTGFYYQHIAPWDGPSEPCLTCLGVGRVPTETVIDKVARAIRQHALRGTNVQAWEGLIPMIRNEYLGQARAAVQAYLKETL